jgi:Flp pilus assembly protein TadD
MAATVSELPSAAAPREGRAWLCFVAALVLLGAWIYHPVRHYGYLDYDDSLFVRPLPAFTHGLNAESVRWAFGANLIQHSQHVEYWCPLTVLSRLLDIQLFGDDPGAFHLTNLILHLVNAGLLALVLRQFTGRLWPSLFVALLFAVHPLNAEVVCWLSARKDLVNAFFFFLTLLAYRAYVRRQDLPRYLLLMLAYIACLLAKPMGMTVPILLLVLDFWPLRRWTFGESKLSDGFRLIAEKVPLLLLALVTGALAILSQRDWGSLVSPTKLPLTLRLTNALYSYGVYLRRVFWPSDLCCFYPHPMNTLTVWQLGGSAVLLVAVTFGVWLLRRSAPMFLAGWCWFVITLAPVCGIMQLGSYGMADRYTYLAMLGPIAALTWWLADRWSVRGLRVAAAVLLLACIGSSSAQTLYWRDDLTAFTRAMLVSRNNFMAHENVGVALENEGREKDAYAHLVTAARMNPGWWNVWMNLAEVQINRGENREAVHSLALSLQRSPKNLRAMLLIGILEKKLGDFDRAEAAFQQMLKTAPDDPDANRELGNLYAEHSRWPEARAAWAAYLRVHPEDTETQRRYAEAGAPKDAR